MTRRNGGYFEPEYRLYLMVVPLILGPVGLLMWGFGLQYALHWSVPAVGSGISYAVLCAVPNIGMTYVVDAHRPVAGEAMTSLTAFKNTIAFGLCFAVYPWILKDGFVLVRITSMFISVVSLPYGSPLTTSIGHGIPDSH